MKHRYIPILRWKRGERVGVQQLSAAARQDVIPLFVLGKDQYVGRKATKKKVAVAPASVVASELADVWGNASFYLDAVSVSHTSGTPHPLTAIAVSARKSGLTLIPATTLAAPPSYQAAVAAVAHADQRGVALRVDLNEFASVAGWIGAWPYAPSDTDLIVDFADNIGTVNALGTALDPAFVGLHQGGKWRTVTMSGTSMPENFSGFAAGQHLIQRTEILLWQRLSSLHLPYRLDYGDYVTISVTPPPSGIRWGYPINVKYSLKDQFLICRGVGTTGPGAVDADVQLVNHAKTIQSYRQRILLPGCWGDTRIDQIATGAEPPQGLEHWVRIGVNRHIEITRHHLP